MKQKTKKLLGVLLALAMVVGLMPGVTLSVWADEVSTASDLSSKLLADGTATIKLMADITTASMLTVRGNKTLDLNGHGIEKTASERVIAISSGAKLTLEDSGSTTTTHYYSIASDTGLVSISDTVSEKSFTGGYITGGKTGNGGGVYNGGTFVMTGGSIIGNIASHGGGVFNNGDTFMLSGNVTISGNTQGSSDSNVYLPENKYMI